jgi:hypothetical protein
MNQDQDKDALSNDDLEDHINQTQENHHVQLHQPLDKQKTTQLEVLLYGKDTVRTVNPKFKFIENENTNADGANGTNAAGDLSQAQ